jgi:succinyl-CoA synthetase beta subunit
LRLLEYEGKELLRRHGIAVPRGWRLSSGLPHRLPRELVVKAQTFGGGRGKRGGIRFARGREEALALAGAMGDRLPDGEPIHEFLFEERLAAAAELYVAALVDRDQASLRLLVGEAGGMDVEARSPESFQELGIEAGDPAGADLAAFAAGLPLEEAVRAGLVRVLRAVVSTLVEEDAELVEINPLFLLGDGSLVAGDARVVLDDDAAGRHPDRHWRSADEEGSAFERASSGLGVVGIEMAGDIVFFSNGAGLTMATLDQLLAGGGRVAAMIELHGVIAHGPERLAEVVELLLGFQPSVLLVNLFYQFRSTTTVAEGLAALLDRVGPDRRFEVVARLRGIDAEESAALLAERGVVLAHGFEEACAATLERSAGRA